MAARAWPSWTRLLWNAIWAEAPPGENDCEPEVRWKSLRVVEIVGEVENVKAFGLEHEDLPTLYRPYEQHPWPLIAFAIRTNGDPAALLHSADVPWRLEDRSSSVLPRLLTLAAQSAYYGCRCCSRIRSGWRWCSRRWYLRRHGPARWRGESRNCKPAVLARINDVSGAALRSGEGARWIALRDRFGAWSFWC